MQSLTVDICENATDAVRKGYMYREPVFLGLEIVKAELIEEHQ